MKGLTHSEKFHDFSNDAWRISGKFSFSFLFLLLFSILFSLPVSISIIPLSVILISYNLIILNLTSKRVFSSIFYGPGYVDREEKAAVQICKFV